jgi:hypothetical protein
MSTLQQSINQCRSADSAGLSCVSVGAQTPGVVVSIWRGMSWVLPWSYLVAANLERSDEDERLVLTFSSHIVTARGQNLQPVLEAVAVFRLAILRNLPAEHLKRLAEGTPLVSRIEVQSAVKISE